MTTGERVAMSLDELSAFLGGLTTTICCHPSRETRVRDMLVAASPLPTQFYKVQPDPACPVDKVYLLRAPRFIGEWTP